MSDKELNFGTSCISIPKIENGSQIIIGQSGRNIVVHVNHHFNWFQKKMIKWCFGFTVKDYSEV